MEIRTEDFWPGTVRTDEPFPLPEPKPVDPEAEAKYAAALRDLFAHKPHDWADPEDRW